MLSQSSLSMNIKGELHLHPLASTIDKTPAFTRTNLAVPTGFVLKKREDELERIAYRSMN